MVGDACVGSSLGCLFAIYIKLSLDQRKRTPACDLTTDTQLCSRKIILAEEMEPKFVGYTIGDRLILLQTTKIKICV
jgi:hypothetical protein